MTNTILDQYITTRQIGLSSKFSSTAGGGGSSVTDTTEAPTSSVETIPMEYKTNIPTNTVPTKFPDQTEIGGKLLLFGIALKLLNII